jgi:citrate lyase beta subunit
MADIAGAAQGAAVAVDRRMIDRPVVLRARALLLEAERGERKHTA